MTQTPDKPDWALNRRERRRKADAEAGIAPRRRSRWPWIVVLLLIVAGGAALYLRGHPEMLPGAVDRAEAAEPPANAEAAGAEAPADETAAPQDREVAMQILPSEVVQVAPATLRETVRLTGTLDPATKLGIPAEVAGRVDEVVVQPGQAAMQGDVLVRIDIEALQNQLEQQRATADATRAQLNLARSDYDRTQSLVNRGVATTSTLDSQNAQVQQLEANLTALERQVAIAEESLDKATITAPFAGIVADRAVDPGAYVSPGTPLLTLVDISTLTLEGAVPVLYAPRIQVGQSVELIVDGMGERQFGGTVERIAPVAAQGTRMLPIYASIDNADTALRGGMFASGLLVLDQVTDAIGVPADAVREDDDGSYVLRIDGDKVVRQPVTIARMWDRGRTAQIGEGLTEGDTIVSGPLARLQPGMTVALIEG